MKDLQTATAYPPEIIDTIPVAELVSVVGGLSKSIVEARESSDEGGLFDDL